MPKEPAFYVRLSGDGVLYLHRMLHSGMAGGDKTLREAVKTEVGGVAHQVRKLRMNTVLAAEKVASGEEAKRASERGVPSWTSVSGEREVTVPVRAEDRHFRVDADTGEASEG